MVDAVGVGKVDDRAGGDREHVRHERLVALVHHRVARLGSARRRRAAPSRVHDRSQPIRRRRAPRRAEVGDLRAAARGRRDAAKLDAAADRRCRAAAAPQDPAAAPTRRQARRHEDRTRQQRQRETADPSSPWCPLCPSCSSEPEHHLRRRRGSRRAPGRRRACCAGHEILSSEIALHRVAAADFERA